VNRGYGVIGTVRRFADDAARANGVDVRPTGDLEAFADWGALLTGVDSVIHLAARVHVMGETNADALDKYRQANVAVTEKILRASVSAGVRRFVFLSSVKAIGEGGADAYTEHTVARPSDPYGVSKLEAEQVVQAIGSETVIETVILRLPLVYGPGVRANFLRLVKLVDKGLPLPLASVRNRRSMIYIGNLVAAVHACLHHENAAGEIFMVSDGEDFSTPGLIKAIAGSLGRKPPLLPFPSIMLKLAGALAGKGQEAERLLGSLSVDSSKLRDRLAWVPPYTGEQGIAETVAWYRESTSH
jgi:nucleoside-diphosphate-sugar epimerase